MINTYYLQKYLCVELFSFVLIILFIFYLPVYSNFLSIILPAYLSRNAGLFHCESVMPVYVSSLRYFCPYLSVCLSICLFVYLSTPIYLYCLSTCQRVYVCACTNQYGYVYVRLPMYVCLFKSTFQYMSISILFVGLNMFVCLSICLFVYILISL